MPLGTGYTVEEQITGQAERGGLQIQVYPMRPEIYENEIKTKVLRAYELCCSSHRRYSSDPGPIARPHGCARSCPSKSYDLAPIAEAASRAINTSVFIVSVLMELLLAPCCRPRERQTRS